MPPGADGMTTEQLVPWLREHWVPVREALDAGTYRLPVRRVVIPKPGGGERWLGVPTCLDRLIQQATRRCSRRCSTRSSPPGPSSGSVPVGPLIRRRRPRGGAFRTAWSGSWTLTWTGSSTGFSSMP